MGPRDRTRRGAGAAPSLLRDSTLVLLDFDGPICSVFAGYPASLVADELRGLIARLAGHVPEELLTTPTPHGILSAAPTVVPHLVDPIEHALHAAELRAIASAAPTPGAEALLVACREAGRPVVVVTNNCAAAVRAYLDRSGLAKLVDHVESRDPSDPRLMKPHPHLLERAAAWGEVSARDCVMIGDQVSDVAAACAVGAASIGFAAAPGAAAILADTGADIVIDRLAELADAPS